MVKRLCEGKVNYSLFAEVNIYAVTNTREQRHSFLYFQINCILEGDKYE